MTSTGGIGRFAGSLSHPCHNPPVAVPLMSILLNRRAVLSAPLALTSLAPLNALAATFPTLAGPMSTPKGPTLDPGLALTRIGIGSCFNQNRDGGLLEVAIRSQPQLFLFMGDNVLRRYEQT